MMRAPKHAFLLLGLVSLAPWGVSAIDAPHDADDPLTKDQACYFCHSLATPSTSGAKKFSAACLDCHNKRYAFGMPWDLSDEATPGVSGNSHNWSGLATNARYGSLPRLLVEDQYLMADGRLQCVVCHDPHSHGTGTDPRSMHTSLALGSSTGENGNLNELTSGSATLTLLEVPSGTKPTGFRVRVRSVGAGGGTIIVSHTYGYDPARWMTWVSNTWTAGLASGPGRPYQDGVAVELDVAGVKISISAGAVEGDFWDFYVGYPFLRFSNVDDFVCNMCHQERAMNHTRARGLDRTYLPNGIRKFSHPVGVGLDANGFHTDQLRVLDADGTMVTDADGRAGTSGTDGADGLANGTNDLILNGGIVRCTTCHRVHNADSNSYTRDAR